MPFANCSICTLNFSLSAFRSLPCGHCYCNECIDKLRGGRNVTCPSCRESCARTSIQRIYLDIVDSRTILIQGLEQMDENSKFVSVNKAGEKLRKEANQENGNLTEEVLNALKDFESRIVPVFSTVDKQAQEIAILNVLVQEREAQNIWLGRKLTKAEGLIREVDMLREELNQSKGQTEKVLTVAEGAKDQVLRMDTENAKLREEHSKLKEDNNRLRQQLEGHVVNAELSRKKIRLLKEQLAKLTQRNKQLIDESTSNTKQDPQGDAGGAYVHTPYAQPGPQQTLPPFGQRNPLLPSAIVPEFSVTQQRDFEGLPKPGFSSHKPLPDSRSTLKRKWDDATPPTAGPDGVFPILLDRKGRPQAPVQLGPRFVRRPNLS